MQRLRQDIQREFHRSQGKRVYGRPSLNSAILFLLAPYVPAALAVLAVYGLATGRFHSSQAVSVSAGLAAGLLVLIILRRWVRRIVDR